MSILLLGNGINQLERLAPKWEQLLEKVAVKHGCKPETSLSNILSYEMLENQIMQSKSGTTELKIHRSIASEVETNAICKKTDWSNTIHAALLSLPVDTVLTTNYDYALERAVTFDFRHSYNTRETIYSLRRFQWAGEKRIFHIHGECGYPRSICLGYEQYAGTLQRIRGEVVRSTTDEDHEGYTFQLADIVYGRTEKPADTWIYDLFLEDVYILGLSLDVSELDLWWLLSYRSKQLAAARLPLHNRIVFLDTGNDTVNDVVPDCENIDCIYRASALNKNALDRTRKQILLKTFGVEYRMCKGENYHAQYADALNYLTKELH